jgi:hypothetical protein
MEVFCFPSVSLLIRLSFTLPQGNVKTGDVEEKRKWQKRKKATDTWGN